MATMMLQTPLAKWGKPANDYASMSSIMGALARSQFHAFRMRDEDTVVRTQHRFDHLVNEYVIQGVAVTKKNMKIGSSHSLGRLL